MIRTDGQPGLFDRLEPDAPRASQLSAQQQAEQKIATVKRHLERLLNTRRGCSLSSPALGLHDFNGHALSSHDLLRQVSTDIRHTIHAFEPRVQVKSVHYQRNAQFPMALHFQLECTLRVKHQEQLLQIDLMLDAHNRYTRVS